MVNILALNGVHTAGKSTIGEMMQEREDIDYRKEVAQKLIEEDGEDWGDESDTAFQRRIFEEESERDDQILSEKGENDLVVVETWHYGEIAHDIEVADQDLVSEHMNYLEGLHQRDDVDIFAAFLDMPLENIWDRSDHFERGNDEIIDFYDRVRANHFELYENFQTSTVEVNNEDGDLEGAYENILNFSYEEILGEKRVTL